MTWRPRFSLRTLAIFLLLVTSGVGLWWHWGPWVQAVELAGHGGWGTDGDWSPDGSLVVATGEPGVGVWRASDGSRLGALADDGPPTYFCRFLPDGERIVTVDKEAGALVRNWQNGRAESSLLGTGPREKAFDVALSPDGSLLVIADFRRGLRTWDLKSDAKVTIWPGDGSHIVEFSPDSRSVAFIGRDELCVLDIAKDSRPLLLKELDGCLHVARYWPDGKKLLVAASAVGDREIGRVMVLSAGDGRELLSIDINVDDFIVGDAEFSPDGSCIAVCGQPSEVLVFESTTGTFLCEVPEEAYRIDFSSDGERMLLVGAKDGASIWRRRRPEWWWGVFWLWEFWLTVAFAGLFVWSVVRDRRALRKREAE